jgi:microcin C transport system substrate-binding protein
LRLCGLFLFFFSLLHSLEAETIRSTYLNLRGEPLYKGNFTHFNYVNPQAPKGGSITMYDLGTFDNFHRYALRGSCAAGNEYWFDTLMAGSDDEADTLYPLIAEYVEYETDYSSITFFIDPDAKDQEGQPITARDVEFSFNIFYEKGVPQFRSYYEGITVAALDERRARFTLPEGSSKDMLLALAGLVVFPKRFWVDEAGNTLHDFSEPLEAPPLGTGPYRVAQYAMGQYVVMERVKDYWAAGLPVRKGMYNFDIIRYDYYRVANVAFEAFKAGEYDFRTENSAKNWATEYTGKMFDTGQIRKEEIPNSIPVGMQALVFNIQRPIFSDRRVRIALNYFFDFQWMNKNLFYGQYHRSRSYFGNTEYEAKGLPGPDEIEEFNLVKKAVPDADLPPEIFTREYNPPSFDGTGNIRPQAREALKILGEAGWTLKKGRLLNAAGEQFSFELLIYDTSTERFAIPFQRNLARYGIDMKIRTVDTSQYINRLRSRDFDMLSGGYGANYYPSSDLMIIWNSAFIDSTWNTAGVMDGAVDYLTETISRSQEDATRLVSLGKALDRLLTWNTYVIPQWHISTFRIAWADKFAFPATRPRYSVGLQTWWEK